jgi:Uma2 family endonuclease
MATAAGVSVEEYLETSYRPDCDYVDGEVRERNVGEWDHSRLQGLLLGYLLARESKWQIVAVPEQRVQVRAKKYRVPDIIAVHSPAAGTPIVDFPPLLCVEILSRDDRMSDIQERIEDYLDFGVKCVWVLDPRTRRGFVYTADGMREAKDGVLRVADTEIAVPLSELA